MENADGKSHRLCGLLCSDYDAYVVTQLGDVLVLPAGVGCTHWLQPLTDLAKRRRCE